MTSPSFAPRSPRSLSDRRRSTRQLAWRSLWKWRWCSRRSNYWRLCPMTLQIAIYYLTDTIRSQVIHYGRSRRTIYRGRTISCNKRFGQLRVFSRDRSKAVCLSSPGRFSVWQVYESMLVREHLFHSRTDLVFKTSRMSSSENMSICRWESLLRDLRSRKVCQRVVVHLCVLLKSWHLMCYCRRTRLRNSVFGTSNSDL